MIQRGSRRLRKYFSALYICASTVRSETPRTSAISLFYCAAMEEINQRRAEFYQPDNNEVIRRIEDRELRKEIYDAINELPDKCKEVFKLSYLHDMKNKEIYLIQRCIRSSLACFPFASSNFLYNSFSA